MTISGTEQVFVAQENAKLSTLHEKRNADYSKYDDKKLKEVAQDFEALFINMMYKSMRSNVGKDVLLDGGMKQEVFEDMLYNEYASMTAKSGGFGLAETIFKQLKGI